MTCILSRFLAGHCYYFAVCAIDDHSRVGPYSDPQSIFLDHNDDSLDLNNNSPAASPLNHAVNHHHNERSREVVDLRDEDVVNPVPGLAAEGERMTGPIFEAAL